MINKEKMFIFHRPSRSVYIPNECSYILPQNHLNDIRQNGLFEEPLIDWSREFCQKDKNFVDIGAHTGTYALGMAPVSKRVYAFEPQRMTYYGLCGSVSLSFYENVYCYNVALGSPEQVGTADLRIVSVDGGGSTLQTPPEHQQVISTESVEVRTLDSYTLTDVGFIKMDVEGNEPDVIRGGKVTITTNDYPRLLMEANTMEMRDAIADVLSEFEYRTTIIAGYPNMMLAYRE